MVPLFFSLGARMVTLTLSLKRTLTTILILRRYALAFAGPEKKPHGPARCQIKVIKSRKEKKVRKKYD